MFAGLNISFQGIYQALQSGMESLVLSLCRQMIFVLPVAYGLMIAVISSAARNSSLVWITFPIAEIVTAAISILFMRNIFNKKIKVLA